MGNTRNLGDLLNTDSTIATADVADGGITTAKLADDAVTQAKIGADAVGTTELANDVAISTSGAITTTGAFTSVGIDDNADATALTISSDEDVSLGAGDLTVSRNEANGTVRLNLSNTGVNGSTEYSELKLNSTAGGTQTSVVQHRNNYGLNVGTTTNHAVYLLQNNANALSIDTSKNVTVNSGNLVIGTSGKGIDFSATSDGSGSMSSELLDDYEEGTWTATLISGGGITFSASERNYVKVGRLVYVNIACSFSGTSSNRVEISGLPFVSTNTSAFTIFHSGGSLPSGASFLAQSHSGHNRLSGGKSSTDMTYSDVNGTTMRITGTYLATA